MDLARGFALGLALGAASLAVAASAAERPDDADKPRVLPRPAAAAEPPGHDHGSARPVPPGEAAPGAGSPDKAGRLDGWRRLEPRTAYEWFKAAGVEAPAELALRFNQSLVARPWAEAERIAGDSPALAVPIVDTWHGATYADHGSTVGLSNYLGSVPHVSLEGCPATGGFDANDAWYVFELGEPTFVIAATCAATFHYDTRLGIFSASLDQLAGNDDNCAPVSLQSTIACCLPAGRFFLAVDGYFSYAGDYDLTVEFHPCTPPDPPVAGGPDAFGYRWLASGAPDGPDFAWYDMTWFGTPVVLGDDDCTSTPVPIGFDFPFYGVNRGSVTIGSNGVIGFDPEALWSLGNQSLPDPAAPNALIAPFWDDLDPSAGGTIHYHSNWFGRFIVQWTDVPAFGGGAPLTFQVVLSPGGDILVLWQDLDEADLASATVGIESDGGADGLTVNLNGAGAAIGDGMAVRFIAPRPLSGGPDAFGHRWTASGDPCGPVFEDVDIRGYGTALGVTGPFDPPSATVALPFAFPFHGASCTQMLVSVYGYLSFHETSWGHAQENDAIPDPDLPNFIVCPWWSDFVVPSNGSVTWYHDATARRVIVQWTDLAGDFWNPQDLHTMQAILGDDGGIVFQYLDMPEGMLSRATVGVEDHDGADGLQVRWNDLGAPVGDRTAIRVEPPRPEPTRGEGGGWAWVGSGDLQGPSPDWLDISAFGVDLGIVGDDQSAAFTLPFAFPFYGEYRTQALVSANGYLTFGGWGGDYSNDPIPSTNLPDAIVCPFWDDLYPPDGGSVKWFDDSGHGRVYVQWTDLPNINGVDGPYTFQAVLHQSGEILFHYREMHGTAGATVGVEDDDGLRGCQVNCDGVGGRIASGASVHLEPLPGRPNAIVDLRLTPVDPTNGVLRASWTPPATDENGNPITVERYLLVAVHGDPYDFSEPTVVGWSADDFPEEVELHFGAIGWVDSGFCYLLAVDDDGAVVAASGDAPWRRAEFVPGRDRPEGRRLIVGR